MYEFNLHITMALAPITSLSPRYDTELARELLELLVGGPEGDLIVEAYVAPSSQEHRLTPEPYDNLKRNYSACREMAPPRTVDEGDNIVEESDEGDVTDEEMSDG
jgi:hypothetical protein